MNDLLPETVVMLRGLLDKYNAAPESYGPDSEKMRAWYRITPAAVNALPALLDAAERLAEVTAERDALRGQLFDAGYREAEMRAEIAALREGRCLADITHRDEDHRQSVCMLPKDHAPLEHDDCMGCTWTDAEHWEASAVDRVANALASHPDPTCDEYASKGPISCGWKRALIDVRWALADGSGS